MLLVILPNYIKFSPLEKILNTKDYGIPQNRERIYIVGLKDKEFEWPQKKEMENLKN